MQALSPTSPSRAAGVGERGERNTVLARSQLRELLQ
jgi:hypothetical protein